MRHWFIRLGTFFFFNFLPNSRLRLRQDVRNPMITNHLQWAAVRGRSTYRSIPAVSCHHRQQGFNQQLLIRITTKISWSEPNPVGCTEQRANLSACSGWNPKARRTNGKKIRRPNVSINAVVHIFRSRLLVVVEIVVVSVFQSSRYQG